VSRESQGHGLPAATIMLAFASPRRVAALALTGLFAAGWLWLLAMATAGGVIGDSFASLGPGMSVFDRLAEWTGLERIVFPLAASSGLFALLAAICAVDPAGWTLSLAALHLFMWMAMALAMMLPTAAPMLRTYAEIAETAASRNLAVVSPLVLAAGYLAVWFAFALAATLLHWLLGMAGLVSGSGVPVAAGIAAGILAVAGAYQFVPAKHACLVKCANPFPFLFANWTDRPRGVFRLGVRQGLFCLACCWAMMLVMFAVGVMNIIWIVALATVMAAEKVAGAVWFSRMVGVGFLAWAVAIAIGIVGV
jgi:predicted metal-binding membrane protein